MTSSPESLPALSANEPDGLENYRSLCASAVLAVLLGLVSVGALAHPAVWILPLLAVLVGLWAVRRIRAEADTLVGMPLALTGLFLGLFFLSWAPTRYFSDRWLVNRHARSFAEEWLSAVFDGQTSKAYQATLAVRRRQPEGTSLDEYYRNNALDGAARDAYFQDGLAQQLAELRGRGRYVFDRIFSVTFDRTFILVVTRFWIYRVGEDQPMMHLQMEVMRESDADGVYWTLIKLVDADQVDRQILARSGRH